MTADTDRGRGDDDRDQFLLRNAQRIVGTKFANRAQVIVICDGVSRASVSETSA
jgi:hypothetical protein